MYIETRATAGADGKANKVDYKEVLSEEDFAVYAKLRDLRKELAERYSVSVYSVFNNKQLAEMVQERITSKTALQKITGVGEARATKYGEPFLKIRMFSCPRRGQTYQSRATPWVGRFIWAEP